MSEKKFYTILLLVALLIGVLSFLLGRQSATTTTITPATPTATTTLPTATATNNVVATLQAEIEGLQEQLATPATATLTPTLTPTITATIIVIADELKDAGVSLISDQIPRAKKWGGVDLIIAFFYEGQWNTRFGCSLGINQEEKADRIVCNGKEMPFSGDAILILPQGGDEVMAEKVYSSWSTNNPQ